MPVLKIWDGSSWLTPSGFNRPKVWNGSTWVVGQPRIWSGSSWGDQLTTGSTFTSVSGGKGTAGYNLFSYGYSTGGNYVDYQGYYSIPYVAIGSIDGQISVGGTARTVSELVFHNFSSEDGSTGYYESKLTIKIAANVSGTSYFPYVDGAAIAGTKVGTWDGTYTTFEWLRGTLPGTGGSPIPGQDLTTPGSNPFGADGTKHTIALS